MVFKADTESFSAPGTVVLKYLIPSTIRDSVFLDYDIGTPPLWLSKNDNTVIVYYSVPNFYQPRIFTRKKNLATLHLLARSDGWLRIIQQSDAVVYLKNNAEVFNGVLTLTTAEASKRNIDTLKYFQSDFRLFDQFNVSGDHFSASVKIKNYAVRDDEFYCNFDKLNVFCENGRISITLTDTFCFQHASCIVGEKDIRGFKVMLKPKSVNRNKISNDRH